MKNKKIIIIGGNGFIGTHLSKCLIEKGLDVTIFDINYPDKKYKEIKYIMGDFFNDDSLFKAVYDKDVIIHSLSTINPGNSNVNYLNAYSYEYVQSVKLFDYAAKMGKRLIFLSSGGTVYGLQTEFPVLETYLPNPINHYGGLKLCLETVINVLNYQFKSDLIIARISNPYGPGQNYKKGVGFIDACIRNSILKEDINIWGNGEIIRDYIYISDLCAMLYVLIEYNGNERIFNVSSEIGTSQNQILDIIRSFGYKPRVNYMEKRNVDLDKIILSNRKIKSIYPEKLINIENGIKKTIQYYESNLMKEKE